MTEAQLMSPIIIKTKNEKLYDKRNDIKWIQIKLLSLEGKTNKRFSTIRDFRRNLL